MALCKEYIWFVMIVIACSTAALGNDTITRHRTTNQIVASLFTIWTAVTFCFLVCSDVLRQDEKRLRAYLWPLDYPKSCVNYGTFLCYCLFSITTIQAMTSLESLHIFATQSCGYLCILIALKDVFDAKISLKELREK